MIFSGDVVFYHDGAYMYCDSAYLYQETNSFEAFSHVMMEQGDTIFVYGDYLHYDGNTKLARLRDNIRMEDQTMTLFTDSLDYDRVANLGYYLVSYTHLYAQQQGDHGEQRAAEQQCRDFPFRAQ